MTMPVTSVVIPYRDRGVDPLRSLNLACVMEHWEPFEMPIVSSDGRTGNAQFNRSAAYNKGIEHSSPDTEVFVFAESDMLCSGAQILEAIRVAQDHLGLVIPFDTYCYHSAPNSNHIRKGTDPELCRPMWVMDNCRSIGAINVVSRATLDAIGGRYDEKFDGNWYDDDAMKLAFEVCAGPTRFIEGRAHHLYHLPGHRGAHLYYADREATKRNQQRLIEYERTAKSNNVAYMRRLLKGEV